MADENNAKYYEFQLSCSSEATGASISCGYSGYFEQDEIEDLKSIADDMLRSTLSDSFWENHYEFDEGIDVAHSLAAINNHLSTQQAYRIVFEHFVFHFKVNGQEYPFPLDIDPDEYMFDRNYSVTIIIMHKMV